MENEKEYHINAVEINNSSFREIIRIYYPVLCRLAGRILADSAEAEDVVTDVFVSVWQQRLEFSAISQLKKYLYTAVRNRCLNVLRTRMREKQRHEDFTRIHHHNDNAIDNEIIYAELLAEVRKEMESLSPRMREVFYLAYFRSMTNDEIARNLQLSNQTVRNQKASALSILRKLIKPRLQGPVIALLMWWQGMA